MTLVVDASAIAAALADGGPDGAWARTVIGGESLIAPCHVYVEVSSVLRRAVLTGRTTKDVAALAHQELPQVRIDVFDFVPLAARVWALHPNLTSYDAAYVALAEELDLPLATLDRRLARATGPTCTFLTPGD